MNHTRNGNTDFRIFPVNQSVKIECRFTTKMIFSLFACKIKSSSGHTSSDIMDQAALAAAHSFTQGNPRLIDNLMTDALTIGSQQGHQVIDAEVIRAAVDNQGLY